MKCRTTEEVKNICRNIKAGYVQRENKSLSDEFKRNSLEMQRELSGKKVSDGKK